MTISVQLKGDINSKHASLDWNKMFDSHLGCHLVFGVMPIAQGCQSGINQILIYIPASQKCHPVLYAVANEC